MNISRPNNSTSIKLYVYLELPQTSKKSTVLLIYYQNILLQEIQFQSYNTIVELEALLNTNYSEKCNLILLSSNKLKTSTRNFAKKR